MTDLNIKEFGERSVGVVFRNTQYAQGHEKVYTYRVFEEMKVKEGDIAVVEKGGAYSFVTVVRIDQAPRLSELAPFRYKWLCCIVLLEDYWERLADEELMNKANSVKSL